MYKFILIYFLEFTNVIFTFVSNRSLNNNPIQTKHSYFLISKFIRNLFSLNVTKIGNYKMTKKYTSVHYNEYLDLDKILNAQHLRSEELGEPAHDEMLFIIIHQVYELWFKQIIHELKLVANILSQDPVPEYQLGEALAKLSRIHEIQKLLIDQINVLETLTPLDFLDFRNYLIPASGFQSFQFRKVEAMLGLPSKQRITYGNYDYKSPFNEKQKQELVELENSLSMFDVVEKWLERIPFLKFNEFKFSEKYVEAVRNMTEREREAILSTEYITEQEKEGRIKMLDMQQEYIENAMDKDKHNEMIRNGEVRLSFKATKAALLINLYRDKPILRIPFSILEKIVDIDESFIMWRFRHSQMVLRMLGRKMGTGGSSGHGYLKKTADEHHIFRDLHNVSTLLIPRSELPELPEELEAKLGFEYNN